jgi:hypothetical protein
MAFVQSHHVALGQRLTFGQANNDRYPKLQTRHGRVTNMQTSKIISTVIYLLQYMSRNAKVLKI